MDLSLTTMYRSSSVVSYKQQTIQILAKSSESFGMMMWVESRALAKC